MSDKLTDEQLIAICTVTRTDDIASRHVRMMAAELLEIRKKRLSAELIAQCEQDKHLAVLQAINKQVAL